MNTEPSRTNGGKGPMQIGANVTNEQSQELSRRARQANTTIAGILRALVAVAPPASRLPESSKGVGTTVTMNFRDEETLHAVDEKRGDLKRGTYLRRVIEWGLRQ